MAHTCRRFEMWRPPFSGDFIRLQNSHFGAELLNSAFGKRGMTSDFDALIEPSGGNGMQILLERYRPKNQAAQIRGGIHYWNLR
jgi:hypothetical protein